MLWLLIMSLSAMYSKVLLFLTVVQLSNALFQYPLAKAFLEHKFCTMVTYFGCSPKQEEIEIMKSFMDDGLRLSIFDVSNRTFSVASVLSKQHYLIGVILDGDCPNIESFLIECANLKFLFDTYHWLVFSSDYAVIDTFENVNLFINADVSLVIPDRKLVNWTILDVYNPAKPRGGDLKVINAGFYNEDDGFNIDLVWNRYYQRQNMTGTTFKVGMVIPENISISLDEYLKSDSERNNNTFSRFNAVTVELCQDFYHFSMIKSSTDSWGYIQKDGELDGLSRALQYDELDFGLAALLYREFRLKVLDFGYGNWVMKSTFIFRHPKNTLNSYELYLRPLDDGVWISTLVAIVLMVIVLRFIITHEIQLLERFHQESSVGESNWSFLIIYNIGELCQQGFSYIPVLASGRIVVLSVLVFFFLIFQFYSASIVSFLLLPPKWTITTVMDLVKSSFEVGMEDVLYDVDYIKTTTDPVAVALYNTKIKQPNNELNFLKPREGLAKVKLGGYAFHTQTSTGYPIVEKTFEEKAICELAEVQLYKPVYANMALAKKSPLRELFLYCNLHQMEVGILHRLRVHWDARKPQCVDFTRYLEIEVGLVESFGALILLGFGIFISLIVLIFEYTWKKWRNSIPAKKS